MKFSIIMPCLFRKEEHKDAVIECIDSVKKHSYDYEFIIVDDGSPLDTQFLRDAADIFIRHSKPKGIAYGWNDGLKAATGEYYVVINDDIVVVEGWLDAMVEAFNTFPNAMAASTHVQHLPQEYELLEKKEWFPGMCFMLKPDTIEKIGYFDTQFVPFNFEDTDYWVRILKYGGTLAQNHKLTVGHKMGQVIHQIENNGEIDSENKKRFIKKWGFDPIPVMYHGADLPWE